VDPRRFRLERGRRFGDVRLGLRLWQALDLDDVLACRRPAGREDVPWAQAAAIPVLARFGAPSSAPPIAEDWFRRTALGDLPGVADDKVNAGRLDRALDRVPPCQGALEVHRRRRRGRRFALEYDLLLDDSTGTYFAGAAAANPQARRGHARDHRRDGEQVLIGLVVTRDGYPLGYAVFAGNRHDGTTVETRPDGSAAIRWSRRSAARAWARAGQGCYLLRSDVADGDAQELWRAYLHLTDAEAAFRAQETDLRVRPVWHQTAGRVQAHLPVCFLAYVPRKTLEGWMARAGMGNSPTTVPEELGRIPSTDVVAPTTDGRAIRLRGVVHPGQAQSVSLDHLGLRRPRRLKLPTGMRRR
jgi:hypothetical protein